MEDNKWLRLISVGLVLAAMAVGYFLLSNRFFSAKTTRAPQQNTQTQQATTSAQAPGSPVLGETSASPQPSNSPAYARIVGRSQTDVQTLPNTGAPLFLIGILASSALAAGLGLRRFPY